MGIQDEREAWAREGMTEIIRRVGHEVFTSRPLVLPDKRCFPDQYLSAAGAVRVTMLRLLNYAGLEDVRIELEDLSSPDRSTTSFWDVTLDSIGKDHVELHLVTRGAAEELPGALASQAAQVVRSMMKLDRVLLDPYRGGERFNDEQLELALAPLTGVVLGWGVLVANAGDMVRTGGTVDGDWHSYTVASAQYGELAWPVVCYALAVYVKVRDHKGEATQIADALRSNQRDMFRRALKQLDRNELIEQLGLPNPSDWTPLSVPQLVAYSDNEKETVKKRLPNEGRPVFRVKKSRGAIVGCFGGLAALPLATSGNSVLAITTAICGFLLGAVLGSKWRNDVCSDYKCGARLPLNLDSCPRCGGIVAGEIESASKRLEAEEALPASWWQERGEVSQADTLDEGPPPVPS